MTGIATGMMDAAESLDTEYFEADESDESVVERLIRWSQSHNIADDLDEDQQGAIAHRVIEEYQIDKDSRADWESKIDKAVELAKQVVKEKSFPWPKASNSKYPLITVAALQFAARAYPAIVNGGSLVKSKVNGFDQDGKKAARGVRVGKHMSYQLLKEMPSWEEDTDRLLTILSITGMQYRKSYFDPVKGVNRSTRVGAKELVWNYAAKSFDDCPRKTEEFELYPYQIEERVATGLFIDQEYSIGNSTMDRQAPEFFLEQHTLMDLDDDGISEPYVVTVHKDTGKLARIVARYSEQDIKTDTLNEVVSIRPIEYYTKYGFMPNPDGSAHDIGFADLLLALNEAIDTTLNQMLDAGTAQNAGGGFVGTGLRMKGGPIRRKIGEYVPLDVPGAKIRENFVDINHPGPSPVLFTLLGFLVEAGRDISSVKDVMVGEAKQGQAASTTLAMVEQGMKMFSAIYKRIHRSFGQELQKLYRLNSLYMPPQVYVTFLDADVPTPVLLQDYVEDDLDISPASDDSVVTDFQKLMKAEAILPFKDDPEMNGKEIKRRYLEALGVEDIEALFSQDEGPNPAQVAMLQAKLKEIEAKVVTAKAAMLKAQSGAILDVAKAEAEEVGTQINQYMATMNALQQAQGMSHAQQDRIAGGMEGMDGAPANPAIPGVVERMEGAAEGGSGGGGIPGSNA